MPSVLWHCWLGGRKGIRPVKTEWWGAGVVICLERGADLHMAQLMPLPLTVSCFSKIQIGVTFLVPTYLGSPGKGPLNGCVCVWYFRFCTASDWSTRGIRCRHWRQNAVDGHREEAAHNKPEPSAYLRPTSLVDFVPLGPRPCRASQRRDRRPRLRVRFRGELPASITSSSSSSSSLNTATRATCTACRHADQRPMRQHAPYYLITITQPKYNMNPGDWSHVWDKLLLTDVRNQKSDLEVETLSLVTLVFWSC